MAVLLFHAALPWLCTETKVTKFKVRETRQDEDCQACYTTIFLTVKLDRLRTHNKLQKWSVSI